MEKTKEAFQDLLGSENHCHGCGCANEKGYRLKSYWEGDTDVSVCIFKPEPHQCAGTPDIVHGGVSAAIIDCHANNLAMALAYQRTGRPIGSDPKIWYVTARMKIDFMLPVSIDKDIRLIAKALKQEGRKTWIECRLFSGEKLCIQSELLMIEIARKD
ncbi:MAG: PaaI family thioesterase [bacterium]|nr:PaaI family thioesterase [bacterium]